jgi:hypothetical protein
MASTICLSGPCRQDRDRTVSFRIMQLGTVYHHDEEELSCFSWSTVKVVASFTKKHGGGGRIKSKS